MFKTSVTRHHIEKMTEGSHCAFRQARYERRRSAWEGINFLI